MSERDKFKEFFSYTINVRRDFFLPVRQAKLWGLRVYDFFKKGMRIEIADSLCETKWPDLD